MRPSQNRMYMDAAISLARTSTMESRHGCVIVNEKRKDGPIVARGVNRHVDGGASHGVFSIHAEAAAAAGLLAIKAHDRRFFRGSTAYVARVGGEGGATCRFSKPCPECQRLLRKLGVRKLYFTFDDASFVRW
jgi:pyrimidine deaminase RibD-like protein